MSAFCFCRFFILIKNMTTVTKEKKNQIVSDLRESIANQKGIYFINFKGISGESARELRKKVRDSGGRMIVARKTLTKLAFDKEGIEYDPLTLEGEVGFVFSFSEGVEVPKVLGKVEKEELISILGGIFEGSTLSAEEVRAIAELPSREELLAKVLSVMSSPTRNFLQVLEGNTKGLLQVLKSIQ